MERKIFLSCKEATYLSSLKEEKRLSFWLNIRLAFHNYSCGPCKRFALQVKEMAIRIKNIKIQNNLGHSFRLNDSEKSEMQDKINQALKKK